MKDVIAIMAKDNINNSECGDKENILCNNCCETVELRDNKILCSNCLNEVTTCECDCICGGTCSNCIQRDVDNFDSDKEVDFYDFYDFYLDYDFTYYLDYDFTYYPVY